MNRSFLYFVVLSTAILCGLMAVLVYAKSAGIITLAVVVVAILPLILRAVGATVRWFSSLDLFGPLVAYPMAYCVWFILGSIDFVKLPSTISFGAFDPIPALVLYYALLGLVAYMLGSALAMHGRRFAIVKELPKIELCWDKQRLRTAISVLTVGMFLGYSYIIAYLGIPLLHLSGLGEERPDLNNIPFYHWVATPFFAAAFTVSFLLLVQMFTSKQRLFSTENRPRALGVLLVFSVLVSLGARAYFIPLLITGLVLYHYLATPLRLKRVLAVMLAIFVALSAFGFARDLASNGEDSGMSAWLKEAGIPFGVQPLLYVGLYLRYTVATFRDVIEVIPAQVPYQHGAITSLPLQSVLPGHHEMSDFYFKNLLGNEFAGQGQPATVLGPFYADFGPVGIFVGMFLWGVLVAKLHGWMLSNRTVFSTMVYAWTMQAGLFGLFGGMFGYLDILLIPLSWIFLHSYLRVVRDGPAPGTVPVRAT